MKYSLHEIPIINELCNLKSEQTRVITSFESGGVKIFYCDPEVLFEVLSYIDGINNFSEIEKKLLINYSKDDIEEFLITLLREEIIKKVTNVSERNIPRLLVIGDSAVSSILSSFETSIYKETEDFLNNLIEDEYEMVVFSPRECTYEEYILVNKKLHSYNKPYLLVNFSGNSLNVGPLVVPNKTVCLECIVTSELEKLNADLCSDEKITIENIKNLKYSFDFSKKNIKLAEYFANKIYCEILQYNNKKSSKLTNRRYIFDLNSLEQKEKEFKPITHCTTCRGMNKNYLYVKDKEELESIMTSPTPTLISEPIKYNTGGIRSKSEEETREILERDLKKLGTKIKIEYNNNNPFKEIAASYTAYCESIDNQYIYTPRDEMGAGKGLTKTQAYFSAGFEIIEHITRQYTGDIQIIGAKYKDIKKYAIDVPYIASTVMNVNTAHEKFDSNSVMDWVVGNSVLNNEKKLIPAFLTFMFDVELKGVLFGIASTGVASGSTLEDAILHGLFEVIEHDAWMIGQSNPYILPIVDYNSSSNPAIKEMVLKIRSMGYDIITRDYTNDLGIPVYRTYITNRNNYSQYSYNGLGCHVNPEIALERSITEAIQFCDSLFGGSETSLVTNDVLSTSLVALYNQHFVINKDVLGETSRFTKIGKPVFEFNSSLELIEKISNLIKEKIGGDVYYVELTKPGMDVKVVRVIVTGDIQRLNHPIISTSKRMFEFGIRCGYSDKLTTYEELFMGNYQH